MKFIEMDFSPSLLLEQSKRNSFYEDTLPAEKIEATGFSQLPTSPNDKVYRSLTEPDKQPQLP